MDVCIPVYDGVDLFDVVGSHEVFKWLDDPPEVHLVAASIDAPIVTRDGFKFLANRRFDQVQATDVLWVPGGEPAVLKKLMHDQSEGSLLTFLRQLEPQAHWTTSVCEGALLLAAAGLLDGYEATTHWYFIPCLQQFEKVRVVPGFPRFHESGNRLTGGGISSALHEALHLVRKLRGDEAAREVQRTIQYFPEPPFESDLKVPAKCEFSF